VGGYLRTKQDKELYHLNTETQELQDFSNEIFDKFDEDGNADLSLDEFVELCTYIDPQIDLKTCRDKYNQFDNDNSNSISKEEFFNFSKFYIKKQVEIECRRRNLM